MFDRIDRIIEKFYGWSDGSPSREAVGCLLVWSLYVTVIVLTITAIVLFVGFVGGQKWL